MPRKGRAWKRVELKKWQGRWQDNKAFPLSPEIWSESWEERATFSQIKMLHIKFYKIRCH
jgi:hypothetical protein